MKSKTIITTLAIAIPLLSVAQQPLGFESGELSNVAVSRGSISISSDHRVSGESALRWDFKGGDTLTIYKEIGFVPRSESVVTLLGKEYIEYGHDVGFILPIYSPQREDIEMRIAFGRESGIDCYTDVLLDYDHWFRFSMVYDRNQMRGRPHTEMDRLQLINLSQSDGTIYLDDLITDQTIDQRHTSPSYLIPDNTFHSQRKGSGAIVIEENHLNRAWFALSEPTAEELDGLKTIEERLFELELGGTNRIARVEESVMTRLRNSYSSYDIHVDGERINGKHSTTLGAYNKLINDIGVAYYKTQDPQQREELAQMGVNLLWHAADVGNTKINWYNGRGFAEGCYLLRSELERSGHYDKVLKYLRASYNFSNLYDETRIDGGENLLGVDSDDMYTNSISKLICVLMVQDPKERVRDMRHFVSFYNNVAFQYAPGLNDTFKPDGSHYHHANVIADRYAYYTMSKVTEIFRILAHTTFTLSEHSYELVADNLRAREFFRSDKYYPWSYVHYGIRSKLKADPIEFLNMALAGSADGTELIDREMAAIYLRLMAGERLPEEANPIVEAGVAPSATPQGNKTMGYFAKGIHRWQDWLVVIGAHSRYVYPMESWRNRADGRGDSRANPFTNWGQTELILPDRKDLEFINNGWDVDGWDYTRVPGTTTVKAPIDSLRTIVLKNGDDEDEHLRSDEAFVGGVDFSDGDGVFVVKLHGHPKYNLDSFRATKSYFMVGDMVLCLGSDIENRLPYYTTQTTLFQNAIRFNPFGLIVNGKQMANKHFEQVFESGSNWFIDSRGVGYFVANGEIHLRYGVQSERDINDTKDVEGEFETAWIDHGEAPFKQSYEYLIDLSTSKDEMKRVSRNPDEIYRVVQQDKRAHIVEFPQQNSCSMVLFEKNYDLNQGVVKGVTHSSIVMTKEQDGKLYLAVSDPDLRLYEGHSSDRDLYGRRHEVPAYSNFWHNHDSIASKVRVFLNGEWSIEQIIERNGEIIQQANGVTVVEFDCQHGLTNEIVLSKIE